MTISARTFPTFKQLYKTITQELLTYENKTLASLKNQEVKNLKAYYTYQKHLLTKQSKPTDEVDTKLKQLETDSVFSPATEIQDLKLLNNIIDDKPGINSSYELNNLNNVAIYLKNQREYFDLLVRYNPGLLMDQQENVTQSAHRVGLEVPR
ncbi:hypothetical protein KGF56_003124 [Candida oxycetoniae]|uniref:ATP synthase assembly factor FMC1, mitochondrial n=1 Tax=Candida oxycetoniae TaxID=497107 RepID=A0AAI9SVY7_9ASCO|nr:uncharacterized protein KGF56_003124 [Candida oxycetoniae]KAI3404088.1 hypothetical protein KGF56_003124 [Candida oxycetoniae]